MRPGITPFIVSLAGLLLAACKSNPNPSAASAPVATATRISQDVPQAPDSSATLNGISIGMTREEVLSVSNRMRFCRETQPGLPSLRTGSLETSSTRNEVADAVQPRRAPLRHIARLVRSPRIELGTPAWKAEVLPLNYDRIPASGNASSRAGIRQASGRLAWLGLDEGHAARASDRCLETLPRVAGLNSP